MAHTHTHTHTDRPTSDCCGFNQSTQQPRRMPQMVTHRRVFVEADH